MKTRHGLILSLALNLGLGVALFWRARSTPSLSFASSREITNRSIRATGPPQSGSGSAAQVVEINEAFHWSQLESVDYRVYAANLRAIGCPESTVRDILRADIRELFRRRVKELVEPLLPRFWELMSDPDLLEATTKQTQQELHALSEERQALLREVLGASADHDFAAEGAQQEQRQARRAVLDFLPEEQIAQCFALEEKFAKLREELDNRQPPLKSQEYQAELKRLQAEQQAAFLGLLSPDEQAEYKLRNSRFVESLLQLPGFELAEDELKEIVRLRQALAQTAELKEPNVDVRITERAEAEKAMLQRLKDLLGPERFAQYQRSTDGNYQQIYQLVSRFELPPEVAANVFDMQHEAQAQASRLMVDQTVPEERRKEMLEAVRMKAERSLEAALGSEPFKLYQSHYGQWLAELAAKPASR